MTTTNEVVEQTASTIQSIQLRPTGTERGGRKALVIYGSRFGNTQRVAQALARGLKTNSTLAVDCIGIEEAAGRRPGVYETGRGFLVAAVRKGARRVRAPVGSAARATASGSTGA